MIGLCAGFSLVLATIIVPGQALADKQLTGPLRFDFGPGSLAEGYTQVTANDAYTPERGYGFTDLSKVKEKDRGGNDAIRSDFVRVQGSSFVVNLPLADYTLSLIAGDTDGSTDITVKAESIVKVEPTAKTAGQFVEATFELALIDGQLELYFSGNDPKINALVITPKETRTQSEHPSVYLAGDSTVQTYKASMKPQAGWGQMLAPFFTDETTFVNRSIGGRSTKTFLIQGRLDDILRTIRPGDYLLIQFGHNDAAINNQERYVSPADYKVYLKTYIQGATQRGATPVLITPVGRRDYDAASASYRISFPEYVQAMKETASETGVALVDLCQLSVAYYNTLGPEGTIPLFLHLEPGVYPAFPDGVKDDTHFQEYGAEQIARLVAQGVRELNIPLSSYVRTNTSP
ncbi:rhamnogalacturonan acetylesterase [Paenibacillus sp. NRS-1781]|uniref:rhamnogalacturonan acetylesterase n=1 Tax=Paenibacillus sp. NRS-1781 TaxID=3233905 RepID=UPI003D2921B7